MIGTSDGKTYDTQFEEAVDRQKVSEVRDLSEVSPKYDWGGNPPDFEADSWDDFVKHPRANDWQTIIVPKGTEKGPPLDKPMGWTVPKKPALTS